MPDRRSGAANPGAEHLEEAPQTIIVESGRRLQDPGHRRLMTRFEHLGQSLREIGRQVIHHGRV
ncbi:MAG TPA: hypothetical protein VGU71_06745 [Candidatus Dormibacteraeota bacterium]|nr:hypothetical protein [Candidatus Dormibacteraeota bacterium]